MDDNSGSIRLEHLLRAHFTQPSSIELTFADKTFSLPIHLLEMPIDRIQWSTVAASATGETMTVIGVKGELVPVSAGVLRYLVDSKYAADADAALEKLQFTDDELERIVRDNPPPAEWYAQPDPDLTRESWK
jgi:hypothetical protein